ncbi:MAG: DHH family phosphoesterase [Longimicrobiales bacterium]
MTPDTDANRERVRALQAFAKDVDVLPILVQRDPDPDGMASAMGVRRLLNREDEGSPIISLGEVTRPENRRMAELLGLQVVRVSRAELNGLRKVVTVDTQPGPPEPESRTQYAVIDHHPVREGWEAEFVDIRPLMGAAATMVTQYLRATGEGLVTPRLATALLYGIRTDTEVLRRGATPDDVEAYAFLQGMADQELLRKIGRPAFSERGIRALGRALAGLEVDGHLAVAYAGRLDDPSSHVLPSLADFLLMIQGVAWSAAAGLVEGRLVMNLRRVGGERGAGELARELAEEEGAGGGHHAMARVTIAVPPDRFTVEPGDPEATTWVLDRVRAGIEEIRGLTPDGPSGG